MSTIYLLIPKEELPLSNGNIAVSAIALNWTLARHTIHIELSKSPVHRNEKGNGCGLLGFSTTLDGSDGCFVCRAHLAV